MWSPPNELAQEPEELRSSLAECTEFEQVSVFNALSHFGSEKKRSSDLRWRLRVKKPAALLLQVSLKNDQLKLRRCLTRDFKVLLGENSAM